MPGEFGFAQRVVTVNGKMTKGNWTEITSKGGYYQGSVYDGTIQMEINANGDRMKGKWPGFGRDPGEIEYTTKTTDGCLLAWRRTRTR